MTHPAATEQDPEIDYIDHLISNPAAARRAALERCLWIMVHGSDELSLRAITQLRELWPEYLPPYLHPVEELVPDYD